MKLQDLVTANSYIALGIGIAFSLYTTPMVGLFGLTESAGDQAIYFLALSFARMLGVVFFGWGFLIYVLKKNLQTEPISSVGNQGIKFSLLISNLIALVICYTQQISIWNTSAGWIAVSVFLLLTLGYFYCLIVKPR